MTNHHRNYKSLDLHGLYKQNDKLLLLFCLCLKYCPHDSKSATETLQECWGKALERLVYTPCAPAARMLVSVCTSCTLLDTPTMTTESQSE